MRLLKTFIRFLLRLTGWAFSLVCAVIILFLAGYWLGWKVVPERHTLAESTPVVANTPTVLGDAGTTNVAADIKAHVETAQERMVRLAKTMVSTTDEREANIIVAAEIASLSLDEVYASLAALQSAPSTATFTGLRVRLLGRLAMLSPHAAFDYARNEFNSGNASGGVFVGEVLQRWAYSDPAAALRAWRDFTSSGAATDESTMMRNNDYGLGGIIRQLGLKNLTLALSEVSTLPADQQSRAWFSLSPLASKEEPRNQLIAAISALPPGDGRNRALSETIEIWARTAGQKDAALQWLDTAQLSRPEQARIEERLAGWVGDDRRAGADWLLSRAKSPEERSRRMENTVSGWASEDPIAAGQWLKAQGVNNDTARAIAMYARNVVNQNPELAMQWVGQIPDAALRQRTILQLEQQIRMRFPHRADELLRAAK